MIHHLRPAAPRRAEIEVKRSRFLALLEPTSDEVAARAFIERVRADHPDARHHCSAFIVSSPGQHDIEHSSDDGEPSGTAGRPMLEVLRGQGLGQVTVVVVRWFGGVLLGTGGLVRAYSDAVREVLVGLDVVRVETLEELAVTVDLGRAGALESALQVAGMVPHERTWRASEVELRIAVPDPERAIEQVASLSGGAAHVEDVGMVEAEIPAGTLARG